jgi:hypothetical protein
MLNVEKVKFCFIEESLLDINDYHIVTYNQKIGKDGEIECSKYKTKEFFGLMGHTMQT